MQKEFPNKDESEKSEEKPKTKQKATFKIGVEEVHDDIINDGKSHILKHKMNPHTSKNKNVKWDWKSLEEQEREKLTNPRTKINEPKTPYLPYEEDDDEYLKKLNEINKVQPTKEILDEVCKQLGGKEVNADVIDNLDNDDDNRHFRFDDDMEVESNEDSIKENNPAEKKDFLNKRQQAYKNEFLMAKRYSEKQKEEDEDEMDLMNETLKNTLFNKLYGKLDKSNCK